MTDVRYPKRFEIYRLEALGDDPYFSLDDAATRFESGQLVTVVPDTAVLWRLSISASRFPYDGGRRFTLTHFTAGKTPLREVRWESDGGALVRRSTLDMFYPEGDPGRRVPYAAIITVHQQHFTDGILQVRRSSPIDEDRFVEVAVRPGGDRIDAPAFGAWGALVEASAPADVQRFGLDAIDAADAYVVELASQGEPVLGGSRWRNAAGAREIIDAVEALAAGADPITQLPRIERGEATILPISAQGGADVDAAEERERIAAAAGEIRGELEYRHGQQITFELDRAGRDSVAAYATALRAAGATAASWWVADGAGVALVHSGDATTRDLTLAVHVVPASWVSDRRATTGIDVPPLDWSRADIEN
ncbi:hypothetical protein [Microbacterium dauci]|uniref:Virus ReqiPepy6 Gp37-like protein n=1 Tax=Microbacterium dauci TaxID=3048008 RepID=A0ABT6ZIT1_9MICO|nr:hypothetical protein [Microbacterium sp. LX3-4]MDJ1115532.1 hypothetical protein [Microbacterium sp. LX3-4]